MKVKEWTISKIAHLSRTLHLTRFDSVFRKIYNPDKRQSDSIQTIIQTTDGIMLHVDTASYLEWTMFWYGVYEPMVKKLIAAFALPGSTMIDVGANVGIHSLVMAQVVGASGRVYAFEPHPKIYRRLKENSVLNNFWWCIAEQMALSDKKGIGFLSNYNEQDSNRGTAQVLENDALVSSKFSIVLDTLDNFSKTRDVQNICLIKIDVEGHEAAVLRGARATIYLQRPVVIFECTTQDSFDFCQTFFNEIDYVVHRLYYHDIDTDLALTFKIGNYVAIPRTEKNYVEHLKRRAAWKL